MLSQKLLNIEMCTRLSLSVALEVFKVINQSVSLLNIIDRRSDGTLKNSVNTEKCQYLLWLSYPWLCTDFASTHLCTAHCATQAVVITLQADKRSIVGRDELAEKLGLSKWDKCDGSWMWFGQITGIGSECLPSRLMHCRITGTRSRRQPHW